MEKRNDAVHSKDVALPLGWQLSGVGYGSMWTDYLNGQDRPMPPSSLCFPAGRLGGLAPYFINQSQSPARFSLHPEGQMGGHWPLDCPHLGPQLVHCTFNISHDCSLSTQMLVAQGLVLPQSRGPIGILVVQDGLDGIWPEDLSVIPMVLPGPVRL